MKIAIIGGIGSGKSVLLHAAKNLSIASLSCDEINSELLNDKEYLNILKKEFPSAFKDGILDKTILSDIIYSDEEKRFKLNGIAHPLIFKRIKEDDRDPLVVEIPLMTKEVSKWFDEIIYVHTDIEKRLDFLHRNRGMTKETALKIMSTQNSEEELLSFATIVINNTNDYAGFVQAATNLFKSLI